MNIRQIFILNHMEVKMIKFEQDVECWACDGTGIYKGMAEQGEAGVECFKCKGSGMVHVKHEYKPFIGKRTRYDVKRVYKTSGGYGITDLDTEVEDRVIRFSEGGVPYEDWLKGAEPKPIRDLHCPLEHFGQGTDIGEYFKENGPCKNLLGTWIPGCSQKNREYCWKYYDENKEIIEG